tara:strand:+ start:673 stop:1548 length:876 start_codon:yes stop_codon:yes gene_type:complete
MKVQLSKSQLKLEKQLRRLTSRAVHDFNMIEDGDVIMCAISGGKDSFVLLDILLHLKKIAPINFDVIAVNLDQKQPGFPEHVLPQYLESRNIDYYVIDKDTYSVVKQKTPEGKTTCALCSRLRRGSLYAFAEEINANKIALGHHMDDIVETLLMNMFSNGRLKAMPPKLLSDDQRNIVIRPLAYCREKDIATYAEIMQYPIIPCNLCGSQKNLQRQVIKSMLAEWDKNHPKRVESIFNSICNVSASQLADTSLFNFADLHIDRSFEKEPYEHEGVEVSSTNLIDIVDVTNL